MRRRTGDMDAREYVYRELQRRRFWKTIRTIGGVAMVFYGIIFLSSFLVSGN